MKRRGKLRHAPRKPKSLICPTAVQYAVRALVDLSTRPQGVCVPCREIAQRSQVPQRYLSKILQPLAVKGILHSRKGPDGGFVLRREPDQIRLLDVMQAMNSPECHTGCAMGYPECSESQPCAMHDTWKRIRTCIQDYLQTTTIGTLARERRQVPSPSARARLRTRIR